MRCRIKKETHKEINKDKMEMENEIQKQTEKYRKINRDKNI